MGILEKAVRPFAYFVERFYPDPLVFVVLLTSLTFALALVLTPTTPLDAVVAWGGGLSGLMAFIAQVALMVVAAHALAHTDLVSKGLKALSRLPRSEWQAYVLVAFTTGLASLVSWSFGLVGGAIVARQVAIEADRRGLHLHYPLLVATAYMGITIWHMGYSGTAPLFVATSGHAMESAIGIIPVTETIFSTWNLITAAIALTVICLISPMMRPGKADIIRIPASVLEEAHGSENISADEASSIAKSPAKSPADRLDQARILNMVLGAGLLIYLVNWFATKGLVIDLNIVIWTLLAPTLMLARSPLHLIQLFKNASTVVGPVLLQYPFYAGIMGLMVGTGLVSVISGWFVALASAETLTFWAFMSGGFINIFVPSGGGQWVVQGPIFIEAAQTLGVEPAKIVMSVAYGDQWTNLIQPFWTLPLLAIAGLRVRDILGYCFVVMIALFFVFAGSLLLNT